MPVLATDWNFGNFLLAMMSFFFFIIWIWLLFTVFADVFSRRDVGGGVKTGWIILVIVLPYLGVFVYLISQHNSMVERAQKNQEAAVQQLRQTVGYSAADEIKKLDDLKSAGTITEQEYTEMRQRVIAGS